MLSRDDAKNIIDKVVSYSKLPQCRVDLELDRRRLYSLCEQRHYHLRLPYHAAGFH